MKVEPGVYTNVPFEEYAVWPALNPSRVKLAQVSMKQFDFGGKQETKAMVLGRVEHIAVFEPDEFPLRCVVYGDRRAGKKWDEFREANHRKIIVSDAEYRKCIAMRDAVRSHRIASSLLNPAGDVEVSIAWRHPKTGEMCKGRIDYLRGSTLVDLKTISQFSERGIRKAIQDYGYCLQFAAYKQGLSENQIHAQVKMIFVQSVEPFDVAVVDFSEEMQDVGRRQWNTLIDKISESKKAGLYPGLAEDSELPVYLDEWFVSGSIPDIVLDL